MHAGVMRALELVKGPISMPAIDVQVVKYGRHVGVAKNRPLRVTPHGFAGVVYKGRVHEVLVDGEMGYIIDAASESWSDALTVCPFPPRRDALMLLKRLRSFGDCVRRPSSSSTVDGREEIEPSVESGSVDSHRPGPTGTSKIDEIIDLLMPHTKTGKAG